MKTKLYSTVLCLAFISMMQSLHSQNAPVQIGSKQIRVTLGAKANPEQSQPEKITIDLDQLADEMNFKAAALRNEAKKSSGELKTRLIAEANTLEGMALQIQIDALELSGKKHTEQFIVNNQTIRTMFINYTITRDAGMSATQLNTSAGRDMKLAREMREEADSEQQAIARLGRMSNANEKELLALDAQRKAMNILQKSHSSSMTMR